VFYFFNFELEISYVVIEFLLGVKIRINVILEVAFRFLRLFLFIVDFLEELVHIHTLINVKKESELLAIGE